MSEKETKTGPVSPKAENFIVPLSDIVLSKTWNRDNPGNINSLATSIKAIGQLVALVVKPTEKEGKYLLVDGRRRYMALKEAGIKDAFVTFTTGDEAEDKAKGLVANLNREGHAPMEIAVVFKELLDSGMKNQEIAKMHGVSGGYVSQHTNLLNLPEHAQDAVKKGWLTPSQSRALLRLNLEDPKHSNKFDTLLDKAVNGMSAQEIEERVVAFLDKEGKTKPPKKKGTTKGRGRPPKTKNYEDLKAEIKPVNKTTLVGYLQANEERLSNSTAKMTQRYLKGVRDGLELAAGLKE